MNPIINHLKRKLLHVCMQVTFVGEGAVDHGGPKREFFRLFAKEASQTYFKGSSEKCRFFVNNVTAVQVNLE